MTHHIIAAGHICIDITPVFPSRLRADQIGELLVPGKLIQVEAASVHTGGTVANTGLALRMLGNEITLLGKVGKDAFGGMVRDILAGYGAGGLIEDETTTTSYSVVLAIPGIDRCFLHHPGANDTFVTDDIPEEALRGEAELFHFGYPPLMKSLYADGGDELTRMFRRVKEHDIATGLDMAAVDPNSPAGQADWRGILEKTLPYVDFFVPSFEELCFMLDREKYDRLSEAGGDMTELPAVPEIADGLAEQCLAMGCGAVLVKCGIAGLIYRSAGISRIREIGSRLRLNHGLWADARGHQPCFRADIVCSGVGAGDASIAAWYSALLEGENPAMCAKLAAAEGAASVTSYDALSGIMTLDRLKARLQTGWKTMEEE